MTQTDHLALSGIGVPPFSARGVTQTLEPIVQARKWRYTIVSSDKSAQPIKPQMPAAKIRSDHRRPSDGTRTD